MFNDFNFHYILHCLFLLVYTLKLKRSSISDMDNYQTAQC